MAQGNGKTEPSNPLVELSKPRYSVDDGQDDNEAGDDVYSRANPPRPGFTKSDQKDMYRMGKVQELKVFIWLAIRLVHSADCQSAIIARSLPSVSLLCSQPCGSFS
jgi:hypothetical protein